MDLKQLEGLMIKHGLVIRAIPFEYYSIVELSHKDKYPDGIEYYDEKRKRMMLKIVKKNNQGGKIIITSENTQDKIINYWGKPNEKFTNKPVIFYDSIEQAVESFMCSLGE